MPTKKNNFEEQLNSLEKIVTNLENGNVPLEDALKEIIPTFSGSNQQCIKLDRTVGNMKEIILTDQEARQVDTFLEFTSSRITEELKIWESLKVYKEKAEKNVEFWKSTAQAVNRLRVQLL